LTPPKDRLRSLKRSIGIPEARDLVSAGLPVLIACRPDARDPGGGGAADKAFAIVVFPRA
jgi:hypothetical protein